MQPQLVLPILVGLASIPLIAWDIHNQTVIVKMGMAWDTGAPPWPYQTPDIVLRLLSFPAYIIAMPVANWLRLWLHVGTSYIVTGPLIIGWWWLLGKAVDSGFVKKSGTRRWSRVLFFAVLASALTFAAIYLSIDAIQWRLKYEAYLNRMESSLLVIRVITPVVWLFVGGITAAAAATRLAVRRIG
jgi:hypothetical protein